MKGPVGPGLPAGPGTPSDGRDIADTRQHCCWPKNTQQTVNTAR